MTDLSVRVLTFFSS